MKVSPIVTAPADGLKERAARLRLHGLLAHWDEVANATWLEEVIEHEETERQRRSLERRLGNARIGRFKPLADFDWNWPKRIDRDAVEELLTLRFVTELANVVLVGPHGVGKTLIAQNLAHQAVLRGFTARFVTASEMLNDLASQESSPGLARRIQRYVRPALLAIDEIGYLSYDARHADLLFEVVSRRHLHRATLITTNRTFAEWNQVFPNAGSVVGIVDRLIHRAEILEIDGDSYRLKEAKERETQRATERAARRGGRKAGSSAAAAAGAH